MLNEHGWLPQQWIDLDRREKAMVIAGIDLRAEEERKQQKEAEAQARRAKHHK